MLYLIFGPRDSMHRPGLQSQPELFCRWNVQIPYILPFNINSMGYGTAVAKYNFKLFTVIATFFSGYEDLSLQI